MPATRPVTSLTPILLDRIRRDGCITFAAFMKACLYDSEHGYYSRQRAKAVEDYYTSPEVHSIFGRLLARQFHEMWELLGCPAQFDLVEFGAGNGTLAASVLGWIEQNSPQLARATRVVLVERSDSLRAQGEKNLERGTSLPIRWMGRLPSGSFTGCFYSNEFVDALPVHRVVQRAGGLREIFVAARGDELVTEEGELSSPALADYLARYATPLAIGQEAEVNLLALPWLEKVARELSRGFLLTIDYGHVAAELYSVVRPAGTLLAYRAHRVSEDVLAWPGAQDLTAHVNFTALIEHGRRIGLLPLGFTSQAKFLLALGRGNEFADLSVTGATEAERYQARLRLKQLIYPEGMGETFKVLIQAKGLTGASLTGLKEV
ncbi:MAG: SAM-dependent methyltransferase [Acidobacteria bacterium]|nr:SAM-dependent methyltransferase [Acidobacteriota bacterium]